MEFLITYTGMEWTTREHKLCRQHTPFDQEQSPVQRFQQSVNQRVNDTFDRYTNNPVYQQREQASDIADTQMRASAFMDPEIFSARPNPQALNGSGKENANLRQLVTMQPEQRLRQLEQFVGSQVAPEVRARYPQIFGGPLDMNDVAELQQNRAGRIVIMQQILGVMNGMMNQQGVDPLAFQIAQEALQLRLNVDQTPNNMLYGAFQRWMRNTNPQPAEFQATNPQFILSSGTVPPELMSAIESGQCDASLLKEMYDIFTHYRTDQQLQGLDQRKEFMKMHGSVEQREYEMKASNMVDNFRTLQPWQQWAIIGLGAYALYKGATSKSPWVKGLTWTGGSLVFGYYLYDRIINGNPNALNDMGSAFKSGVNFTKDKVFAAGNYFGIPGMQTQQEKLTMMSRFLDKHRLDIAPAASGMAAMATVPFKTVLGGFTPNEGQEIGGFLAIDESGRDPGSGNLYKALNDQFDRQGMSGSEKQYTLNYLKANGDHMGKAVAHVCYLMAASEPQNVDTVKQIDEMMDSMGAAGNYDYLTPELKDKYQRMVIQGIGIARSRHGNKSFAQLIAVIDAPATRKSKKPETAARQPDPETPTRSEEFDLYRSVRDISLDDNTSYNLLMREGGNIQRDYTQFLDNAVNSGLVQDGEARTELRRKFDLLLADAGSRGETLSQTLIIMEKLKYAILVTAAQTKKPLDADTVVAMAGPAGMNAQGILSTITSFLNPSNFAAFLNRKFGLGVPAGFTNINSLEGVQGMLVEPWFFSGPVGSNNGKGFDRLRTKVSTIKRRFDALRNYDQMANRILDDLKVKNPDIIRNLGGEQKTKEVLLRLMKTREYEARLKRTEEYLAQRMANRVVSAQVLRHGTNGNDRFEVSQGISDNEQFNLERDFDKLYKEIVGDHDQADQWLPGMWHKVEDLKVMYEQLDIDTLDLSTSAKREAAVSHVINIGNTFTLRLIPRPQIAREEQDSLRERVETIKTKMAEQMRKDLSDAGVPTTLIEGNALFDLIGNVQQILINLNDWEKNKVMAVHNQYKPQFDTIRDVLILLESSVAEPAIPPMPAGPPPTGTNGPAGTPPPNNPPAGPPPNTPPAGPPPPNNPPAGPPPAGPPAGPPPGPPAGPPPGAPDILDDSARALVITRLQSEVDAMTSVGRTIDFKPSRKAGMIEYVYKGVDTPAFIAESSAFMLRTLTGNDVFIKYQNWERDMPDNVRESAYRGIGDPLNRDPLRYIPPTPAPTTI